MAFQRPSLQTLIARVQSDIEAGLPGSDARLRYSLLDIIARAQAGVVHGLYGHLDFLSRQIIIDTAESDYLERWAGVWGITRKVATAAQGNVTFTGVDASVIPLGATLQRSDGAEYTTNAAGTITGGVALVAVTAITAGGDANAAAASTLTLMTPVSGVDNAAIVDGNALTGGVNIESDDLLRARALARIQAPPHGGADFDYVQWALEVAGVTRAWVYPGEGGLGMVVVRFMMDDTYADGIPLAGDESTVQSYIDGLRPVTAAVTVAAPVAVALNFTLLVSPLTAAVKAAVQTELAALIQRDAIPGGTILISKIREAISLADGETDYILTTPAADITHATGQIAVMGTITWA